jgi:hypothetical protein
MKKPHFSKNFYLITYKLLNDLLFILLVFFTLNLLIDGLIPGLVSDHISFLRLILFLSLNISAIMIIGHLGEISIDTNEKNKKTTIFLAVISTLLIGNGLLRIDPHFSIVILIFSLAAIYLLYKNFFTEN